MGGSVGGVRAASWMHGLRPDGGPARGNEWARAARAARRTVVATMVLSMVATVVPSVRPVWGAAADPGVTCDSIWVGPITGAASWAVGSNWSTPTPPTPTNTVCFGAEHGGSAVAGVRIDLGGEVQIGGLATDAAAAITLLGGSLTVTGDAGIDGITLDGIELALQTPTTLASGATAGGRGLITGDLTVAAGATISADGLVFQGDVVNDGSIVGLRPLTAQGGSIIEFELGTYSGSGVLTAPVLELSLGSDVEPAPTATVTIGSATVDTTSTLTLHTATATTVTVVGRLSVGASVDVQQLLLEPSAWMTLLDGAVFAPTSLRSTGDVLVDGVGSLRPAALDVDRVGIGVGALRRPTGAAAVRRTSLDPIGGAASPIAGLRIAADTAEQIDLAATVVAGPAGLVRADEVTTVAAAPAAPFAVTPVDPDGLTIAGSVHLDVATTGTVDIGAEAGISQLDTSVVELSGTTTLDLAATAVTPFRNIGSGRSLTIDGCLVVNADREYLTGTGLTLAFVADGDGFITPTVVSATQPTTGARWEVERSEPLVVELQRAGVRGAASFAAEQAEYRLVSRLGAANRTSCEAPPGDVQVTAASVEIAEDSDAVEVTITVDNTTASPATLTPALTGTGTQPLETDDLTVSPASLVAPVGTSTQVVSLLPSPDGVYETGETGELRFGDGVAGSVSVTVIDDEAPPTIVAMTGVASMPEGLPITLFPVASGPSEVPVSIPFTITGVSGDFTDFFGLGLSGVLAIDQPFIATSVDDDIPEGDETVRLSIGAVTLDIVVLENDFLGTGITLVPPAEPVAEGGTAQLLLRFPRPVPSGVTLSWTTKEDGALPPEQRAALAGDFSFEVFPLVQVLENQLEVLLEVDILTDAEVEGEESFLVEVQIDGMTQPLRASVTIAADPTIDPMTVSLAMADPSVGEADGTAQVEVTVTGDVPSAVSFPLTVSTPAGGGAEPGLDIAETVSVEVSGPGVYTVDLAVVDDEIVEGAEDFEVALGEPALDVPVTFGNRRVVGTIVDDDSAPVVDVLAVATDVAEGDPIRITLSLSGDLGTTPVTVPYTVEPVGATPVTPAADLFAAAGTVVVDPSSPQDALRPGEFTLSLGTVDDGVFEGPEQYRIVLGQPIGATLVPGLEPVSGVVLDDELAPVISARVRDASLAEGGATVVEVGFDAAAEPSERPLDVTIDVAPGVPAVTFDTDVTVSGTTTLADGTRRIVVRLTTAAPLATVAVQTVEDAVAETVERMNVTASELTVGGVVFPIRRAVAGDSLTVRDDDGDVVVAVAVEPTQGTEGQTLQLHVSAGVNDLDGDVAVSVEFAPPSSALLFAGDPATDIRVGGDVLPASRRVVVPVPKGLTQDARVPIELVDDSLAEEIETISVRIVAVTVGGVPRAFTPSTPGAAESEVVILDDDEPVDETEEAEQVEAFRAGMLDLPDLLGSWAGLFDFTPGAWDGADPVDLPVGADRLATLAEVGPAAAAATSAVPIPATTDRTWEEVVQRLTDPNDNGTPNEPDEGACDVVHVVRGIGGFPDAPNDGLIEVRCDLTMGDLIEQAQGGTIDQWNDETEAMREIAELLALDADDGLRLDMTIQLVFGLDSQSFYVRATTGFDARLHGALHLQGSGTVLGVEDVDVDGDAAIDVRLLLGPEGSGKLRGAQLALAASELLRPEVRGSASADLAFTRDDDEFEWNGSWTLQTPVDGDPLVELDEQRLRLLLQVDGLETGVVDRPDSVLVEGTFANGFWTLEGSLDDAAINGFVVDHAEFTAIVDNSGIFRADADVDLVVNEATDDPVEVTVHWERDPRQLVDDRHRAPRRPIHEAGAVRHGCRGGREPRSRRDEPDGQRATERRHRRGVPGGG